MKVNFCSFYYEILTFRWRHDGYVQENVNRSLSVVNWCAVVVLVLDTKYSNNIKREILFKINNLYSIEWHYCISIITTWTVHNVIIRIHSESAGYFKELLTIFYWYRYIAYVTNSLELHGIVFLILAFEQ